ncbi:MAG TPA: Ig-like domain-containing protein [Gemmatimonadaceae bacterium]|nr:Ig-like domain-containing protein [Gemmatimonadaceae bacterium]
MSALARRAFARKRIIVTALLAAGAATALSCGGDSTGPGGGGGGGSIQITPNNATVELGATVTLRATDSDGNPLTGSQVHWDTEDADIAIVSQTGVVTGVAEGGPVRIAASVLSGSTTKSAFANVTVTPKSVGSVDVTGPATLDVGSSATFVATAKDAAGNPLTGRTFTWASSHTNIATVDATGLVTAKAPGGTEITATSGGKTGVATLTVAARVAASVTITPDADTIVVGQTTSFSATVKDAAGAVIADAPVIWTSNKQSVAPVDGATGLVTGVSPGTATITAKSGTASDVATVVVDPVPVNSVTVSPGSVTITAGESRQLSATVTDASGNPLNRPITWSSDNTAAATVNGSGLVTGVAAGSATITATSDGKTGTANVTVNPVPVASVSVDPTSATLHPGDRLTLTATVKDADGNTLTGRTVVWSSDNPDAATVPTGSGTVTARNVGTAIISATAEGHSGSATISVVPVPVASVDVTPSSSTLTVGDAVQLTATPRDADGNALSGRDITWDSDNDAVATVNATGRVTTHAEGDANITATVEGQIGVAAIHVNPVPVATVTVSPSAPHVTVGDSVQLTATMKDAGGNTLAGRTVTWSSNSTGVATVDANGKVHGVAEGSATITATSEGKSGTATVTVDPAPVSTVEVTPSSPSITAVDSVKLTATAKDAGGAALTGRTITWSSGSPGVATVTQAGMVHGESVGSATITAASGGKSGTATITVTAAPVATVTVTPPSSDIAAGDDVQLDAALKDARNRTLTGRTVTWSSNNTSAATVDATGKVHGVAEGSATITASSEGKSGTATVQVTPAAVASVSVTPSNPSITAVDSVQLAAGPRDAANNPLTGRTASWSSSAPSIASVDAVRGMVHGVSEGNATITASVDGVDGSTTVTVTPAPVASIQLSPLGPSISAVDSVQLTATLFDALDRVLTGRSVSWTSDAPAVASVDPSSGMVRGASEGSANITASVLGVNATTAVTVTPAPVDAIAIDQSAPSVVAGSTVQLTATTKDAKGRTLTGRSIAWSSDTESVATVDPATGLVQGVAEGTAQITATSEGKSASVTVTVSPAT